MNAEYSDTECNRFSKTVSVIKNMKIVKKMHKGIFRFWNKCCISDDERLEYAEAAAIEARLSPADWLGKQTSCCICIPIKIASILICILSFSWATLEIQNSDEILDKLASRDNEFFDFFKVIYSICAIIFLLGSALLLLGILTNSYRALHFYVWIAFCYNCFILVTCVYSILKQLTEVKDRNRYQAIAISASIYVLFHTLVFYCIAVVNTLEVHARMEELITDSDI